MDMSPTRAPHPRAPFAGLAAAVMVSGARLAGVAQSCRNLGLKVEMTDERYAALGAIADDPGGYLVLLQDCTPEDEDRIRRSDLLLRSIAPRVVAILVADADAALPPWAQTTGAAPRVLRYPVTMPALRQALNLALEGRGFRQDQV